MSASPEMLAAFRAWVEAEAASVCATGYSDDDMSALVDHVDALRDAMIGVPAASAEDLLLKSFPALLAACPPGSFSPPLRPVFHSRQSYPWTASLDQLVGEWERICPAVAEAIALPGRAYSGIPSERERT